MSVESKNKNKIAQGEGLRTAEMTMPEDQLRMQTGSSVSVAQWVSVDL